MLKRQTRWCGVLAWVWTLGAIAQPFSFVDDFEDGDASDGLPARWVSDERPMFSGSLVVENGSLTSPDGIIFREDLYRWTDVTVTAFFETGAWPAVTARHSADGRSYYVANMGETSVFVLGFKDGVSSLFESISLPRGQNTQLFDALELSVAGDRIQVFAWAQADGRPSDPWIDTTSDLLDQGFVGWVRPNNGVPLIEQIQAVGVLVPEPVSLVPMFALLVWQRRGA